MRKKSIDELYQKIVNNSWTNNIENYFEFIKEQASHLAKNKNEINNLIDEVLKKILSNLKKNVDMKKYNKVILNMGKYSNQDGYNFTISLIKTYYKNEFKFNNQEYSTLDIMYTIVKQHKEEEDSEVSKIFHYMLACLFRLHYALYIKDAN